MEKTYGTVEIYVDQTLGIGSYGKVCRAKYGHLPCAAKLLHDTLFQFNDPGIDCLTRKFEQECQFLSTIKHPNIVQYLGTSRDPESGRPALLMELMDESLTKFLERSTGPLPYHIQINICHDVALALSYLHLNSIIHRDLSSNNVLLIGEGSKSKVTDFGMSKLMDMNPNATSLTHCPGTLVYMPPEALTVPPRYSNRLDCFSHGVLAIQIITRHFPGPGDATTVITDDKFPTGRAYVFVPEIERRKRDVDLIELDHSLLPVILQCLSDTDMERPSADELCERLASLRKEPQYAHSLKQSIDQSTLVQILQDRLKEREVDNKERTRNLETIIDGYQMRLLAKEEQCIELKKELELVMKRLEPFEPVVFPIDDGKTPVPEPRRSISSNPLSLTWRQGKPAPEMVSALHGSSVVHDNIAYFSKDCHVYEYCLSSEKWTQLHRCQKKYFSLAIVNDKLAAIGGCTNSSPAALNTLLTLNLRSKWRLKWEGDLPPMPVGRIHSAAVTTCAQLIVSGGRDSSSGFDNGLSALSVMDLNSHQWSVACCLPKRVEHPHMALSSGYLYLSDDSTVFSCCLEALMESCKSPHNSMEGLLSHSSRCFSAKNIFKSNRTVSFNETRLHQSYQDLEHTNNSPSVWTRLRDIPVKSGLSLVTLGGNILAVGGRDVDLTPTGAIHCYNSVSNSWHVVGELPTKRHDTLCAVLGSNEVVVLGGNPWNIVSGLMINEIGLGWYGNYLDKMESLT